MRKLSAVIFCAGLGTRIKPIVAYKPKCLIEVAGKPVIDYVLENLRAGGVNDIWVTLHHNPLPIIKHLGDSVKYFAEPKLISQEQAVGELLPVLSDPFLVANGDTIVPRSLVFPSVIEMREEATLFNEDGIFGGIAIRKRATAKANFHMRAPIGITLIGDFWDVGTPKGLWKARKHFSKRG